MLVLIISNAVTLIAQVPDYIPNDGLLAWYPFSGSVNDFSGNAYHGINNGAVLSNDRFGNPDASYSFMTDSYVELPELPGIVGANQSATFSVWYRGGGDTSTTNVVGRILSIDKAGTNQWGIIIECPHNIISYPGDRRKIYFRCPTENNEPVSAEVYDSNLWHNITIVVDHIAGEYRYYFDNVLDESMSFTYTPSLPYKTTGRRWAIGRTPGVSNSQFYGQIDDLGFWNRALTSDEIEDLYEAPPDISLEIEKGSIMLDEIGQGVVLKSSNGDCWYLTIDDNGSVQTTKIRCPE